MASIELPRSDDNFGTWISNFATIAAANATDLGYTAPQVTALTTTAASFNTALTNSDNAKDVAKSKTQIKNDMRLLAEELFRAYSKAALANPDVSNSLKVALGMKVAPTPPSLVSPPTELAVDGFANGDNKLAWKRAGNSKSSVFIIEAKIGMSPVWNIVAVTNRVKFTDAGRTPGEQITYRVSAQRAETQSSPSNEAVVYSASEGETFMLKQAA